MPVTAKTVAKLRVPGLVAVLAGGAVAWAAAGRPAEPRGAPSSPVREQASAQPEHFFTRPSRASARPVAPVVIPEVPRQLASALAVTAEVEIRGSGHHPKARQRKFITRTADRVHIGLGREVSPEWLFVRNGTDGRRMSATLIDHEHSVLIEYDESELRTAGLGRGWADVVAMGVEPEALDRMEPTGRSRLIAGHRAIEKRLAPGTSGRIRELWWSDEAAVPLRVSIEDGSSRREIRVRSLRRAADESLLRDPRERYPDYRVMDVSDYREKHHSPGSVPMSPDRVK